MLLLWSARILPGAARLVFLDEVVVVLQEVQCTVPDHRAAAPRPVFATFSCSGTPLRSETWLQDRIPELRRQGGAATDDDAERDGSLSDPDEPGIPGARSSTTQSFVFMALLAS